MSDENRYILNGLRDIGEQQRGLNADLIRVNTNLEHIQKTQDQLASQLDTARQELSKLNGKMVDNVRERLATLENNVGRGAEMLQEIKNLQQKIQNLENLSSSLSQLKEGLGKVETFDQRMDKLERETQKMSTVKEQEDKHKKSNSDYIQWLVPVIVSIVALLPTVINWFQNS